jgi:hypothetical protein
MASEHRQGDQTSGFSFGVRELRQAQDAPQPPATQRPRAPQLETVVQPAKTGRDVRGNDPYNTSGSFDRSRNWARVGKR